MFEMYLNKIPFNIMSTCYPSVTFHHLIVETFTVGSFQLSASVDSTDFYATIIAVPAGNDPDWHPTLI
jgi:hypothetical protein